MGLSKLKQKTALGFFDWLGLTNKPNWMKARWLGALVGVAIVLTVFALALAGLATLLRFLSLVVVLPSDHEAIRNIGLAVVAVFGAPFVVWRAAVAQKQADTGEQSFITDQINKAVSGLGAEKTADRIGRPVKIFTGKSQRRTHLVEDSLSFKLPPRSVEHSRYYDQTSLKGRAEGESEVFDGIHVDVETWPEEHTEIEWQKVSFEISDGAVVSSYGDWTVFSETAPNIEVRLGAIYALERICQDSPRDHIRIMEILTAYIRENSPVEDLKPSTTPFNSVRPRSDIQAALDVIGRRSHELISLEHSQCYRLDLRNTDLSGANCRNGQFDGAILAGCRLEAASFRGASLRGARLHGALLNFCNFWEADLCGAILDDATMNGSDGFRGNFYVAKNTQGLSIAGADISAIKFLSTKKVHYPTFGTKDTVLSRDLDLKRKDRTYDMNQFVFLSHGLKVDDEVGVLERLTENGFLGWSPFKADDGATGELRSKVWKEVGISGFPFEDD